MAEAGSNGTTRREFLRTTVAGVAAVATGAWGLNNLLWSETARAYPISQGVVIPDPTLCIGCMTCEVICGRWHREQGLSDLPRIHIFFDDATKVNEEVLRVYPKRGSFSMATCKMCPSPDCVAACPYYAMRIDEAAHIRYIDETLCQACGRCQRACPFLVEGYLTRSNELVAMSRIIYDLERNVYVKCDLCRGRPEGPICVERCPINKRIKQGILKLDRFCLDLAPSMGDLFAKLV